MSRTVRPTWLDGLPDPHPNQQSLCTICSLSKFERRTVRLTYADGPRFSQRACFHPIRSATWSAVQTGQSAPLTRTVRPCLFSTHSRTHEQPTHTPYVQPLYHILALFIHVSSCQLPIIAYIHDILIMKHHVHSCRDCDAGARRG